MTGCIRFFGLRVVCVLALLMAAATARAALFLQLTGVQGESIVPGHVNDIDAISFTWGGATRAGRTTAHASFSDISITKNTDKSSPQLIQACASGAHFTTATLYLRKSGGDSDYMKIEFSDVIISGYNFGSGAGDLPSVDTVTLNFTRFRITYNYQPAAGGITPIIAGWDIVLSKPI